MNAGPDAFTPFEPVLASWQPADPWRHRAGEPPHYNVDYPLLGELLSVPVSTGSTSESGRFARGIDVWLAHELRRCGFGPDEVWPRATRPRVLPRDVATLLDQLPARLREQVRERLLRMSKVAPSDARVLGRAYDKQVDVCIARWERGPELLISTKAMTSSFRNNLANRFEEAYGDAANLRGRHPLAAVGFVFVLRSTILGDPEAFERAVDMLRKLRDQGGSGGYTATALVLVEWADPAGPGTTVQVRHDEVPADLDAAQLLTALVDQVLTATPVQHHVQVRRLRERRDVAVTEADALATPGAPPPGAVEEPAGVYRLPPQESERPGP